MTVVDDTLRAVVREQPYPLVFVTISGAHRYGFASPDSDYDLRGIHVLPVRDVVGLDAGRETIEVSSVCDGLEIDLVSHDAKKFFLLLLKKNGYVLEQLYSPLVVHSTPEHEELKSIAAGCITRHHWHHYCGFAETQWGLFGKEAASGRPRIKPLLYVYRVLLTGIYLMRTGIVEANLVRLNPHFGLSYVDELIERKSSAAEKAELTGVDLAFHEREYRRLQSELEEAGAISELPERLTSRAALHDLLVRLRLKTDAVSAD